MEAFYKTRQKAPLPFTEIEFSPLNWVDLEVEAQRSIFKVWLKKIQKPFEIYSSISFCPPAKRIILYLIKIHKLRSQEKSQKLIQECNWELFENSKVIFVGRRGPTDKSRHMILK